jgi:hypothetical protein
MVGSSVFMARAKTGADALSGERCQGGFRLGRIADSRGREVAVDASG